MANKTKDTWDEFMNKKLANGMTNAQAAMFLSNAQKKIISDFVEKLSQIIPSLTDAQKREIDSLATTTTIKTMAYTLTAYC